MSPPLSTIEIVEGGTVGIYFLHDVAGLIRVKVFPLHQYANSVGIVGGYEHTQASWMVTKYVVGSAPDEYAVAFRCRLAYGGGLNLEETGCTYGLAINLALRQETGGGTCYRGEETALFVATLEDFSAQPALRGCQVEELAIEVLHPHALGEDFPHSTASARQLASNTNACCLFHNLILFSDEALYLTI